MSLLATSIEYDMALTRVSVDTRVSTIACILTYYPTYSPTDRFHFPNLKFFSLRSIEYACIRHIRRMFAEFSLAANSNMYVSINYFV